MKKHLPVIWLIISLSLSGCDLFTIQSPVFCNLNFETAIKDANIPYGWEYDNSGGYTLRLVDNREKGGKCLRIYCEKPDLDSFHGVDSLASKSFYLKLSADLLKGKNLEVKAKVKTKAVTKNARLELLVYERDVLLQTIDNSADYLRGTKDWTNLSIETKVDENATKVYIMGTMAGRGTAWFDDFEIKINGKRLKDQKKPLVPTNEEIEWLRQHIYPITSTDIESPSDDLAPLIDRMKEKSVIALGGATYASAEEFKVRNRIMKALAEKEEDVLLAPEISPGIGAGLNAYINGTDLNLEDFLWQSNSFVDRQEFHQVIKWIKAFNKEQPHITIVGYENNSYDAILQSVEWTSKDYPVISELVSSLKKDFESYMEKKYNKREKNDTKYVDKQAEISTKLQTLWGYIGEYVTESNRKEWLLYSVMFLRVCVGEDNMYESKVENLLSNSRNKPEMKTVLWSANQNINRSDYMMGKFLADKLGDKYLSVGFAFYDGAYYAHEQKGAGSFNALTAYPGTYEYYFHQLGEPCFMIDLREIREDTSKEGQWLRNPALFRQVGTQKRTTEFTPTTLIPDYDILIFIDHSTATKHIRL